MKKVLILAGSPRMHGNSNALCEEFAKGAAEAGHEVEKINIARKKIAACLGCNACYRNDGSCVQKAGCFYDCMIESNSFGVTINGS